MFSHVMVGCADLARAGRFYDAVLAPLGLIRRAVVPDGGPPSCCWTLPGARVPEFMATLPFDGACARAGNGGMVALLAGSPATVDAAHAAGLAAGGSCEGAPGERPQYGRGYYGAYMRDPDGNKVHVVYRGDLAVSADSAGLELA